MKTMQATELRQNFFKTLRKLSDTHEPVQIMRWGAPVAVLSVTTARSECNRLQDIRKACLEINEFLQQKTFDDFSSEHFLRDAVFMNLIIIGEAISTLPTSTKKKLQQVPWKHFEKLGNDLVCKCGELDLQKIWNTLMGKVPALFRAITPE